MENIDQKGLLYTEAFLQGITLVFCIIRSMCGVPFEEFLIELAFFEGSQIILILLYIVFYFMNKPPQPIN